MNPPQRRAPRTRDLRLSLTALLAFLSWAGLLAFFTVIPVLYLIQTGGLNIPALKAAWPLSAPLIIGGACVVAILFILYYLMASGLRCQVCGGPVFGGGETHRKHPNARKFMGLSYSRRVAWEILTTSGFHCMHCQTFCRNRRRGPATETLDITPGSAGPPVFQANPAGGETAAGSQLFNTLFAPAASEIPVPATPAAKVPPVAPASPPLSSPSNSPFSLVGTPLGGAPAAIPPPRPIAHPERTPWAHHPGASPFVETPTANVMNPSIPEMPVPAIPPTSPAGIRALIPPQPRSTPAASAPSANSPFTLFAPPAPPVSAPPAPVNPLPTNPNPNPAQPMSTPFTFPAPPSAAPVMPPQAPAAGPISQPAPAKAPELAPAAPSPAQVVAQVTKLMEKTRTSLDEMFAKMLGELKKVMEAPDVVAAPVAKAPVAPLLPPAPEKLPPASPPEMPLPPPPAAARPTPAPAALAPSAPAAITLPSLPGMTPPKPAPAPVAPPVGVPAPAQAAEMNAVLARAFAQSQRQTEPVSLPPAPANSPSGPNGPDWRTGHPQSPFSLVPNQPEPARPVAAAPPVFSAAPPSASSQPAQVLPFPPFPQSAALPPAAALPLPPVMPPTATQSPFSVMASPPAEANHGPSFPSPFADLPELNQHFPEPPPMPAPFTFLAQQGDQFVADPTKLPPQWPAPSLPVANTAPANPQALQFAQMQAQQLAQFQAQQLAQLQEQAAPPAAPVPPPFLPAWAPPTQNGQH